MDKSRYVDQNQNISFANKKNSQLKSAKSQNKEVISLNCSYIPLEIIAAAGYKPKRVWPEGIGDRGQEMLPADYCPYSRAFLSDIYEEDENMIMANSCDAMRRVYDVLCLQTNEQSNEINKEPYNKVVKKNDLEQFILQVPRKTNQMHIEYFKRKLKNMLKFLLNSKEQNLFQEISKETICDMIKSEIDEYNSCRSLLRELRNNLIEANNKSFTMLLDGIVHYFNKEKEEIKKLVSETTNNMDSNESKDNISTVTDNISQVIDDGQKKFIISSSCLLGEDLIKLIEKLGLNVVGLDSCLGERSFDIEIDYESSDTFSDLIEILAKSYLKKPACPRMMEPRQRLEQIENMISSRNADGIIYFIPKFCDQADYDFKYIKEWAEENKFPVLQLEGEYGAGTSGQLNTRVEAFKEALQLKN